MAAFFLSCNWYHCGGDWKGEGYQESILHGIMQVPIPNSLIEENSAIYEENWIFSVNLNVNRFTFSIFLTVR